MRMRALNFVKLGHDVQVFTLRDEFSDQDMHAWSPLEPRLFDTIGSNRLGFSPHLYRALSARRFDIIHQHGIWQAFSSSVSKAAKKYQTPLTISAHGMLDPWAVRHSAWKKIAATALYQRRNLAGAKSVHALNQSEAEAFKLYGLCKPISVIPNGADVRSTSLRPQAPSWWPSGRVLLFLGRIHPKKGLAELVEAFAGFLAEYPKGGDAWSLVIAGWDDGGHQAAIESAVKDLGLTDRILFAGPQFGPAKDAVYANADAFILPSYSEGLPMTVLEAWSWGVPVLMTAACNLPDGFSNDAAVEITTAPQSLKRDLLDALSQEPLRLRKMGERGRALVERDYSWLAIAEKHIEAYRWQIAGMPHEETPSFFLT